jgi:hypothetical protein
MRESLARHFGAFKKAIEALKGCYEKLKDPNNNLKDLDPTFPDRRTYRSLQTRAEVKFKYIKQVDPDKLLFLGNADDGEWIYIKFVRRYSQGAHEKCAGMGVAPRLRGFEDIGAGWRMVIMDTLDMEYKPFNKHAVPARTCEDMKERLVELHQAHFVHGDIRDVNIMTRKDGKPGFMLVDFDWSGTIGKVRYPMNVNKAIWRPDDVSDGKLIEPSHDIAMLEYIFWSASVC